MAGSTSRVRRPTRTIQAYVVVAILVLACGGPAATAEPTPAPTATAAMTLTPTASAVATQAALATAAATAAPTDAPTLPPVTEPPVTEPPITQPPVTAPPIVAPAIGVPILVGDQQRMTVLAAEQWPGTTGVKPASGKAFFTVSIRIDALAVTSWDSADFKLKDAGGKFYLWRTGRS